MDAHRTAGEGRYAHVEREQRWLLGGLPAGLVQPRSIVDVYLTGTRLRLRRVESDTGVVYKFGQKVRPRPDHPDVVKLTNIYLSAEEYAVLRVLPGRELHKIRWRLGESAHAIVVDEFRGHLLGLVLAELELASDEETVRPPFPAADVTMDDRFSGGSLATATASRVRELLAEAAAVRSARP